MVRNERSGSFRYTANADPRGQLRHYLPQPPSLSQSTRNRGYQDPFRTDPKNRDGSVDSRPNPDRRWKDFLIRLRYQRDARGRDGSEPARRHTTGGTRLRQPLRSGRKYPHSDDLRAEWPGLWWLYGSRARLRLPNRHRRHKDVHACRPPRDSLLSIRSASIREAPRSRGSET